jgi:hypothetical protein
MCTHASTHDILGHEAVKLSALEQVACNLALSIPHSAVDIEDAVTKKLG